MFQKTIEIISIICSTVLGVGFLPFAPGTWGSFVPIILLWFFPSAPETIMHMMLGCVLIGFLTIPLTLRAQILIQRFPKRKEDPSYIVIDEVAGQLLTFGLLTLFCPLTPFVLFSGFIAFRVFDILKPWPIRLIENRLNQQPKWQTFSILLDDLLAGILAACVVLIIFRTLF